MVVRQLLKLEAACLSATILMAVSPSLAAAQVAKLYPVDEAHRDSSFVAFRAQLLQAIEQQDTAFILDVLAPDICSSLGGDGGIDEFRSTWFGSRGPDLWEVLGRIVSLGGTFHAETIFIAPYTFGRFPDEFDGFSHGAIVGKNVRVRAQPDLTSATIASLSYDIIRVPNWRVRSDEGHSEYSWVEVALPDGQTGFVASRYIQHPHGYRAGFLRTDERWLLRWFLAGE